MGEGGREGGMEGEEIGKGGLANFHPSIDGRSLGMSEKVEPLP